MWEDTMHRIVVALGVCDIRIQPEDMADYDGLCHMLNGEPEDSLNQIEPKRKATSGDEIYECQPKRPRH